MVAQSLLMLLLGTALTASNSATSIKSNPFLTEPIYRNRSLPPYQNVLFSFPSIFEKPSLLPPLLQYSDVQDGILSQRKRDCWNDETQVINKLEQASVLPPLTMPESPAPLALPEDQKYQDYIPIICPETPILPPITSLNLPFPVPVQETATMSVNIPEAPALTLPLPELPSKVITEHNHNQVVPKKPIYQEQTPIFLPHASILPVHLPFTFPELPAIVGPIQEPAPLPVFTHKAPVFPALSLPALPTRVIDQASIVLSIGPQFDDNLPAVIPETSVLPHLSVNELPTMTIETTKTPKLETVLFKDEQSVSIFESLNNVWPGSPPVEEEAPLPIVFDHARKNGLFLVVKNSIKSIVREHVIPDMDLSKKIEDSVMFISEIE